jgi:hypothetical protein
MTLKQTLKKTLEWALVTIPVWGSIGTVTIPAVIETHKYNSLSTPEKIEYLENKLNTEYQRPPVTVLKMGGAIVVWGEQKEHVQEELSKLKGEYK